MLLSADEKLVRRDEALPELATLLDPEAFVAAIEAHVPFEVESARVVYVKYKAGTNCLAGYKIQVGGREVDAYAKTFGPDSGVKVSKALERRKKASDGPGRIVLEDRDISAMFFPNDDKLKRLGKVFEDQGRFVRGIVPELRSGELRPLRYKPERRYVAQLLVDGEPRATVKFYREDDYRRARENARSFGEAFKTSGPFRVARMIGDSRKHSAVAFEWREGRPLGEAMSDPSARKDALHTVGAALAELHAQPPSDALRKLDRRDEARTLASLVEPLVFNSPDLEAKIRNLAKTLSEGLLREPSPMRPVHGDFYEDQVLIGGGAATILDFDEAALGDPAADLGLFIAHLEKDAMLGSLDRKVVAPAAEHLLEGHRSWGGSVDANRVRFCTAVGLFRLAPHPFRTRNPRWPNLTRNFLERAESLLVPTRSMSA